jgi:hypothetical protein
MKTTQISRKLYPTVTVVALVLVSSMALMAQNMITNVSYNGGFSIDAPAPLVETVRAQNGIDVHLFQTERNGVAYLVAYNDLPYAGGSTSSEFDSASRVALSTFDGRVLDSEDFTFRGYSARVLGGMNGDRSLQFVYCMYQVNQRFYQVLVMAPTSRDLPSEASRFLKSFDLT